MVELTGPVFGHAAQRMRRGFRWLMLVWTDGQTVIPADFALLTTQKAEKRRPAYVVCDRWFTTPTLTRRIVNETGCEVIGMLKNSSLRYEWSGRLLTLAQIYRVLRGSWSRQDLQRSVVAHLLMPTGPVPVKLVFIRDRRSHSREWLALLSTDIRLPDDEVVRLYVYQAFLRKLPDPLRNRIDGLQKSRLDQKSCKAA